MNNNIIFSFARIKGLDLPEIYKKIRGSSNLEAADKLLLYTLIGFISSNHIEQNLHTLAINTSLNEDTIKSSLQHLNNSGWLFPTDEEDFDYYLAIPENDYQGSKIARAWARFFGTKQLTPHTFSNILTYIEDGLEEDLIIEVIKISARQARGNPANYCRKILADLLNRKIYTREEFEREGTHGKQISEGTGKNKKATREKSRDPEYLEGYR